MQLRQDRLQSMVLVNVEQEGAPDAAFEKCDLLVRGTWPDRHHGAARKVETLNQLSNGGKARGHQSLDGEASRHCVRVDQERHGCSRQEIGSRNVP